MSPKKPKLPTIPVKEFGQVEVNETILVGGDFRTVTHIEQHDLDAYIVLFTGDDHWVRNRYDKVGVRADAE